jgi:hypothetical protein
VQIGVELSAEEVDLLPELKELVVEPASVIAYVAAALAAL